MHRLYSVLLSVIFALNLSGLYAQNQIPSDKIIENEHLIDYLKEDIKVKITEKNRDAEASLAEYFRVKFSERFFYDWLGFSDRFELYNKLYNVQSKHMGRAEDHMQKFADSTTWLLPFNYLNGDPVDAYALRHLARQHKMVDIAFMYYYNNKDPKYISYFVNQMQSLNYAFESGKYEKIRDGNGVYEVFRSGYRILNWLSIHNMFLGEESYTDEDQLTTIATLLQHGAHLYERNSEFHSGNHQTRGMSALAMLSILFRDFEGADLWYERAMKRLEEHIIKEINDDGFQFERSVHYHISDIENYFYVYQLVKNSQLEVSEVWEKKLFELFNTLTKIAYPDKTAPVLQDDTDNPWAEKNDISGAMTLGYLLFEEPLFGYFATSRVEDKMFWFLKENQIKQLNNIEVAKPKHGSLFFSDTKYYIMREGWDKNDKMMIINAGLDDKKPDHQHGDMLGVQAMANGKVIFPNYQVRYSLNDYYFFKNSMVKNVALVDDELQGKEYKSNKGGSGFGKFKNLPNPSTIAWQSNENFDLFVGTHDGFENIGVKYTRQVIYVKDDFWIVKDNFESNSIHEYKQVWQGHYTDEFGPDLLRSTFDDASACDIYQLINTEKSFSSGKRGKEWTVVTNKSDKNFNFLTVVYPYKGYLKRINEANENPAIEGWKINNLAFQTEGSNIQSIAKEDKAFLFSVKKLVLDKIKIEFSTEADVFVQINNEMISIYSVGDKEMEIIIKGSASNKLNKQIIKSKSILKPGDLLECEKN